MEEGRKRGRKTAGRQEGRKEGKREGKAELGWLFCHMRPGALFSSLVKCK